MPRPLVPVSRSPCTKGSLATELMNEELKEYRFLLTLNDVTRASVPFPDTLTIEYPDAEHWRENVTEKRIKRYESVSLDSRDPKTQGIHHGPGEAGQHAVLGGNASGRSDQVHQDGHRRSR